MMKPGPDAGRGADGRHEYLYTSCGRELTVGWLALGDVRSPVARVFVDLGDCPGCAGTGWAAFTVAEARQFARTVLAQAAAAEQAGRAVSARPVPAAVRRTASGQQSAGLG